VDESIEMQKIMFYVLSGRLLRALNCFQKLYRLTKTKDKGKKAEHCNMHILRINLEKKLPP
jgi:hypothetical protein